MNRDVESTNLYYFIRYIPTKRLLIYQHQFLLLFTHSQNTDYVIPMAFKQFMHIRLCTTIPSFPQLSNNDIIYHKSAERASLLIVLNAQRMEGLLLCQNISSLEKRRLKILHIRLRTNCSVLNKNLFLKCICDSPFYRCGAIENAFDFFLDCQQNAHQRAERIYSIFYQHITVGLRVILFGEITLSTQANTIIFKAVHKYILDSKRF